MGKSHRVVLIAILSVTSGWGCSNPLRVDDKPLVEGGPRASFQKMIARMKTPADPLVGPHGSRHEATPKFRKNEALPDEVTRTKSLLEVIETFRTRSAQQVEVASNASLSALPIPAPSLSVAPQVTDKAPDFHGAPPAAPADALPGPSQDSAPPRSQQETAPEVPKEDAMPGEEARTKSLREAIETIRTRSAQQAEAVSDATPAVPPVPAESLSPAPQSADKAPSDAPFTPATVPPVAAGVPAATPQVVELALASPPPVASLVARSPDRTASPPDRGERLLEDGAYRIGPEDVIHVAVWDNKELTSEVTVRPDGKISLPLIQDVQAEGLTASELASLLRTRLTEFIKGSQVSVIVTQVNAPKIYVLGYVQRPGPYPLRSDMSVLQALAVAGGFTPFASRKNIKLVRGTGDRQEVRRLNYDALIAKGSANYLLKPGDTIVVP